MFDFRASLHMLEAVAGLPVEEMSNYDYEPFSDGDWDDRGELAWNEHDWRKFLHRHEQELSRYWQAYKTLLTRNDRLDEAARLMGWDNEDWLGPDGFPENTDASWSDREDEAPMEEDLGDPYTLHRHPVYVVTRTLYSALRLYWEAFAEQVRPPAGPQHIWAYAQSLHEGESNTVMALNALDMGDYALSICQMKRTLSAINNSIRMLNLLRAKQQDEVALSSFRGGSLTMLFDLRELYLRVMRDCREEMEKRFREDSD